MKKLGIIGAVLCMIFIVSFLVFKNSRNCWLEMNNTTWHIELAETPEQREKGLMNRVKLCDTCGMLFVFDDTAPRNFWMKNTYIPLDMYFYDAYGELVDMAQDMRPESETETGYPMDYTSQPAQYVMEVIAGSQFFQPELFNPTECL